MGSAQRDIYPFVFPDEPESLAQPGAAAAPGAVAAPDLRQQAAARLAAHRQRRARGSVAEAAESTQPRRSRHKPIAEAVAARFAHTPSYRAFLAEQAQRAIDFAEREAESAAAEAEIAARNAQAVAAAQNQLLAELDLWNAPQQFTPETAQVVSAAEAGAPAPVAETPAPASLAKLPPPVIESSREPAAAAAAPAPAPVRQISTAGLTVRLYEDIGRPPHPAPIAATTNEPPRSAIPDLEEALALDEEIAFRQAPVFEPFTFEPLTPLPANLLEFPRQLVAARKARPRLAEGPLLEETPRSPQLRIFEVEPEQISHAPAPPVAPEWAGIHLDAQPAIQPETPSGFGAEAAPASTLLPSLLPPQTAPLQLRIMATLVDGLVLAGALMVFVAVAAHFAQRFPSGITAATSAAGAFAIFFPLYQLLFFTLSDQTPGMRYARIGLCTFTDENPSRAAIRRRILAQLVALCPFGLGILWALLDEDGLGWHDRISRMYQRAY